MNDLNNFIDSAVRRNRPIVQGTPGTLSYMKDKVKKYATGYLATNNEIAPQAETLISTFREDSEGEKSLLKERLEKAISGMKGKYKEAHWG